MSGNIKIGVIGAGVIGKRVATAANAQQDMDLVGVGDVASNALIHAISQSGVPIYSCTDKSTEAMNAAGIEVRGTISELLDQVEIVVDATPPGFPENNIPIYRDPN